MKTGGVYHYSLLIYAYLTDILKTNALILCLLLKLSNAIVYLFVRFSKLIAIRIQECSLLSRPSLWAFCVCAQINLILILSFLVNASSTSSTYPESKIVLTWLALDLSFGEVFFTRQAQHALACITHNKSCLVLAGALIQIAIHKIFNCAVSRTLRTSNNSIGIR